MKSTAEIKYDDIIIADAHLNGHDHDFCKNALWGICNVIKKAKKVSTEHWDWTTKLNDLYALSSQMVFWDEDMKTLVLYESDIKISATNKKDLTKCGFTVGKKDGKTALSYREKDFSDVIFGLKLFVDICVSTCGDFAEHIFHYGDISIVFEGADVNAKIEEVQNIIAYDRGLKGTLSEDMFDVISAVDRAFIHAYDEKMNELGYDFGNRLWGASDYTEIAYVKTGVKSKNIFSRIKIIHIDGKIQLRLYFNNVDNHREHIENAPQYIKNVFAFEGGDCRGASCGFCPSGGKIYTIDGKEYYKCMYCLGVIENPSVERLADYIALFMLFNPPKKTKK